MEPQMRAEPVVAIIFAAVFILIMLTVGIITLLVWCKIFSKAGYHWAMGLLMFVPVANIIMPLVLAFAQWPIEKELQSLKQQNSSAQPPAEI